MAVNPNEIFYGQYDPPLWYSGYDQNWILGRPKGHGAAGKSKDSEEKDTKKSPIELKMPLCCEGCVDKVKSRLIDIEGVTSVSCNVDEQKVTVDGDVKPEKILKAAKKISSRAEIVKKKDAKKK